MDTQDEKEKEMLIFTKKKASLMAQTVKNLPAMQETWVCSLRSLTGKIPWKRAWQPTAVFCLRTPWTEKPDGLQPMGSQRVRHD